jgi:hypothetical protein
VITPSSIGAALRRARSVGLGPPPSNRSGNSYALTIITPILPGKSDDLRAVLGSFNPEGKSPLVGVPDVHFARWVVIDRLRTNWPRAPKRPSILGCEYLLFSADLTAPAYRADKLPASFLEALVRKAPYQCDAVWKNCYRYPDGDDPAAIVDYLMRSRIEIALYYAAFPNLTPVEVTSAIKVREQLSKFVIKHQDVLDGVGDPKKLRLEYLEESKSWGF